MQNIVEPNEYREKHSRCATCKYFCPKFTNGHTGMCDVKERLTKRTKGRFCKIYKFTSFKGD